MSKIDLKSLLATMGTGEIHQLLAELKRYASASATIDSLKRVFESGHFLEFQLENGDCILVDEFIESEPVGEDGVHAMFGVFGVMDNIKLCVHLNTGNEWTLNSANPSYCFSEIAPTFLVFEDGTSSSGLGAVQVTVCKFQRGVYDESCETYIERETSDLFTKIISETKQNAEPSAEQMNPAVDEDDALMNVLESISTWLQGENRRVILDVSRSFTFEDRYSTSQTHNNFSLTFKCAFVDAESRVAKFGDCSTDKADFILKADDFTNGPVKWDERRKNLLIMSEDKSYVIRISFMDGAKIANIEDETMSNIAQAIK